MFEEVVTMGYERILVTGGAGFIGSHIVDRLVNEDREVTIVDNLSTGLLQNIAEAKARSKQIEFFKGDIRDYDLIKKVTKGVDAVFHEAALVSVTQSFKDPILTNDVNVNGTLNLLKACLDNGVRRFVFASSSAVYGKTSSPQMNENMATNPTNPYGVSKLTVEGYLRSFHMAYGLDTVALRYFNIYGPRQSFDIQSQYGGVIVLFLGRLLKDMPPIIYGDGEQTRDFVYVDDIVEANMLALNSKKATGETINIGSGTRTSVNSLANVLKKLVNKTTLENIYENTRLGDVKHGYSNINKARELLEYAPKYSLRKGLLGLVNWYVNKQALG